MGDAKPTVVVTGISGNLGSRLLPQLGGDQTKNQNVLLPARAITNRAFQKRQLPKP